ILIIKGRCSATTRPSSTPVGADFYHSRFGTHRKVRNHFRDLANSRLERQPKRQPPEPLPDLVRRARGRRWYTPSRTIFATRDTHSSPGSGRQRGHGCSGPLRCGNQVTNLRGGRGPPLDRCPAAEDEIAAVFTVGSHPHQTSVLVVRVL